MTPNHRPAGTVPGQFVLERPLPPPSPAKPRPAITARQSARADRRFNFVVESIINTVFMTVIWTGAHLLTGAWSSGSGWLSMIVVAVICGPLMATGERWGRRRADARKGRRAARRRARRNRN